MLAGEVRFFLAAGWPVAGRDERAIHEDQVPLASVGSTGDSYGNALAEAFNSLFKAELVRNRGPWKSSDDLEIATAEYIDWFNHRRLHGEIGMVPPVELEDLYHHDQTVPATADAALASL